MSVSVSVCLYLSVYVCITQCMAVSLSVWLYHCMAVATFCWSTGHGCHISLPPPPHPKEVPCCLLEQTWPDQTKDKDKDKYEDIDKDSDRDNDMGQGGHTNFLPLHPRTSTWAALIYGMCSMTKSVTSESWVVSWLFSSLQMWRSTSFPAANFFQQFWPFPFCCHLTLCHCKGTLMICSPLQKVSELGIWFSL